VRSATRCSSVSAIRRNAVTSVNVATNPPPGIGLPRISTTQPSGNVRSATYGEPARMCFRRRATSSSTSPSSMPLAALWRTSASTLVPTCSSSLGYDPSELLQLPASVTASFAGVGNPHAIAPIERDAVVLDIGCGAGTDLLLAARRIGSNGRAIGVDMTVAMRERALAGAESCGLTNVDVRDGDATTLPVEDATVDVVISNGVLNLVPDKTRAVREIARVLKRGGRAQIADIVIGEVLPDSALRDIDLWTG